MEVIEARVTNKNLVERGRERIERIERRERGERGEKEGCIKVRSEGAKVPYIPDNPSRSCKGVRQPQNPRTYDTIRQIDDTREHGCFVSFSFDQPLFLTARRSFLIVRKPPTSHRYRYLSFFSTFAELGHDASIDVRREEVVKIRPTLLF